MKDTALEIWMNHLPETATNQTTRANRSDGPGKVRPRTHGSALIAMIAAIMLFSVLAAALVPMIGSSSRQAAFSNLADRAYYLAESGHRYAVSMYRHAPQYGQDPFVTLENLDGTYTLGGSDGGFELKIFSFFYLIENTATAANQTNFTVHTPGSYPADEIAGLANQQVQIDGTIYTLQSGSTLQTNQYDLLTFNIDTPLPATPLPADTIVYPATHSDADQMISTGDDLSYQSGSGDMFPLRNGQVLVDDTYLLSYRLNDRAGHTFRDVQFPGTTGTTSLAVANSANIALLPYTRIEATGIVGSGEPLRKVIYYSALPSSTASPQRFTQEDKFENTQTGADNWQPKDTGTTAVEVGDEAGNTALKITRADEQSSLIELNSSAVQEIFNGFRTTSGGYLSYDAQVKVGFYGISPPPPENPIPVNVAAGLTFRLNSAASNTVYNGYGLSFVQEDDNSLPNGIVPSGLEGLPLMVLWQQIGATRNWLAYKYLRLIFDDNFDSYQGIGDLLARWTREDPADPSVNIWTLTGTTDLALYFGDTFAPYEKGAIVSRQIQLPANSHITLNFEHKGISDGGDTRQVSFKAEDAPDWTDISLASTAGAWQDEAVDLTAEAGKKIQIKFYFERLYDTAAYNGDWHIDNIQIVGSDAPWPVQDATLLLRLQEAAVVQFTSTGNQPVLMGDRVQGESSLTTATVIVPPLISSGDWETNDAAGTLLLNDVTGTDGFSTGETLGVTGRGSNISVTVAGYDNTTDRKVNIIKAYYARASGSDSGNSNPLDGIMHTYPRREATQSLEWPVDEGGNWTAERDYFRLIQWDEVNDGNVAHLDQISFGYAEEDGNTTEVKNTVIRSYDPNLQSQEYNEASPVPELGLHAYGSGATHIYFDDFGVQLLLPPDAFFPTPLQQ